MARKTSAARPRPQYSEALEQRLLLGELVTPPAPSDSTDAPAEISLVDDPTDTDSPVLVATAADASADTGTDPSTVELTSDEDDSGGGDAASQQLVALNGTAVPQTAPLSTQAAHKASKLEAKEAAKEARAERKAAKKAEHNKGGDTTGDSSSNGPGGPPDGSSASTGNPGPGTGTTGSSTSGSTPSSNGTGGNIGTAVGSSSSSALSSNSSASGGTTIITPFIGNPQLSTTDVQQLLERASAATPSEDAIIAVVDRQGNILGVRTEADVQTADLEKLVFSIDGAVSEARTAAFFSNDQAALTSRTVRFISQTTITEREVNSDPSIADMSSTIAGPGIIAPIGLGGHFPPGVANTPPVDLYGIEYTNRDSIDSYPGGEGRFNADYLPGQEINAPDSYGVQSGLEPDAQPRGIATLPGGIPLYRDTDGNGIGDTLIGGIGVFFPGPDGYASYEQGFVHGDGKTAVARENAPKVLEAEYIALAAIGSSRGAGVTAGAIDGVAPVSGIDLPFGRIDLVGITLEGVGPTAGIEGVKQLLTFGHNLGTGTVNGTDQMVTPADLYLEGEPVPSGWLVAPHDSAVSNLTAADVTRIINQGIAEAKRVRAAIRLPIGQRTKMVFAVTDTDGEILGLYRMPDATYFSLDVAVAKARNVAYYDDPTDLQPQDQVLSKKGIAFTSRTFRFLVEPRYPSGVDGSKPGPFSILNEASINPKNAENIGAPAPASAFQTAQGYNSFNIGTNFHDTSSSADNQNGVIFFPGSSGIYKNGVLVGGLGVSGDGVDQDDVVTVGAIAGYNPPSSLRADRYFYRNVRLPYTKFLRNPYG